MPGTGDIYSTVEDLARFNAAVHFGSLLSVPSVRALFTTHARVNQPAHGDDDWVIQDGYGYGTFIGSFRGIEAYFHPGDNPGYQALNAWLPQQATSIVILVNDEADELEHLLELVLSAAALTD
jgi:CubicO group peptidase (beta-lactamase class C family)